MKTFLAATSLFLIGWMHYVASTKADDAATRDPVKPVVASVTTTSLEKAASDAGAPILVQRVASIDVRSLRGLNVRGNLLLRQTGAGYRRGADDLDRRQGDDRRALRERTRGETG